MPSTTSYDKLHQQVIARPGAPERLAALRQSTLEEIEAYEATIAELRKALGLSQAEVAQSMEMTQSAVSQFESGSDLKLSTLRNYLAELGFELRLSAVDPNGTQVVLNY